MPDILDLEVNPLPLTLQIVCNWYPVWMTYSAQPPATLWLLDRLIFDLEDGGDMFL
jgi:hypothetical protein